ncbi:MAG: hypothetical protein RKO25_02375 [Candidatus Contendobacter sp.]|nr:hypothetical protein [Candidatus Contendobacter sp.]
MCKKWFFGFKDFPRKEKSLEAANNNYELTHVVRGNVFSRVGGIISEKAHVALVEKAKNIKIENIN